MSSSLQADSKPGSFGSNRKNILDDPVHGFYIPTALFIFGIALTTYMSGEYKLLWGFVFFFGIVLIRMVSAFTRKDSVTPNKWHSLELLDQTIISKNSAIYRFKMKSNVDCLDFAPGENLAVRVMIDGTEYVKFYTPISPRYARGYFDILVKSYPNGDVSKHFGALVSGQNVDFKGPVGKLNYSPNSSEEIGFIVGGSGITPLLQLVNEVVTVPEDLTKIHCLYLNETENDILLKEELDEMAEKYPNFKITYVLNKPKSTWTGNKGLLTKELVKKYLPTPDASNRLFICGPTLMNEKALQIAKELKWKVGIQPSNPDDQVFVY